MDFARQIMQQPLWVQLWVAWMIGVNSACVFFLRRVEARWVLAAWIGNMITMQALFALSGYNRLLGLSHVLWWTPLLGYLVPRLGHLGKTGGFGLWVRVLVATIGLSLVIDYIDVARYLLGDRR